MRTVSSIDAKARFGELLDSARQAPVTVTRHGRPAAVVLSIADYERMRGHGWQRLQDTLDAGRTQAAANGLTDELLDELLDNES